MSKNSASEQLFARAQKSIPGGVNSPVRAFQGVGGKPIFFERGEGAYLTDADGTRYIDYVGSWGPMIAGHSHPAIKEAVAKQLQEGLSFGAPTALETEMAETLCRLVPSMDQVRMVNSGTEATMSAVRLARGHTGRDMVVKFEGCYHGHVDGLLVKAGSGALTLGEPTSPGIPVAVAQQTLIASYNDIDSVDDLFTKYSDKIACVIVEPVAGNMNCIPPADGFLQHLRQRCDNSGALLIFDEVMTGFRVALGGAQSLYDVRPDLSTFGKVIGGGLPVGAFGGRADIMASIAPCGPVYQAGTLSGNPVAMAAGLANLKLLQAPGFYEQLSNTTANLLRGLSHAARQHGISLSCNQVGSMFGLFFTGDASITRYAQLETCDLARFKQFFHGMLQRGVYFAPSAYESGFVSSAHGEAEVTETIAAASAVFATLEA